MSFLLILRRFFFNRQTSKIMKISFVLLFVGLLQLSAGVFSQNAPVPLDVNKQYTIKELFQTIEDNTSYRFFYNADLTDLNKTVSMKRQTIPVNDLLDLILNETAVSYKVLENNMIVVAPREVLKQDITITGTVTDGEGPMPGVNVSIKGMLVGVVTDLNGKYIIRIPNRNVVLTFSFVGYNVQEIAVGDRTVINVTLSESAQEIQEVVVVGYGSAKRENLTGAVATMSGDKMGNRSVSNLANALQGNIANLNILPIANSDPGSFENSGGSPGARPSINIRGYTGINSDGTPRSDSPLIVIDGVQGGDIHTVNMNDVESITVLKDAASAAIYGSSAPFGVIIITTKKGKLGQKPTITYTNNIKFATPISLPKMMNSLDFALAFDEICANADRNPIIGYLNTERIREYMAGERKEETVRTGEGSSAQWAGASGGNANNDWFKIHFRDVSMSQQHNLGITGGSNNSDYYIGLGYNDQDGMYRYGNDSYKRFNARTKVNSHIAKWLTVGFRGSFVRELRDTPYTYPDITGGNILHQIARKWPTTPLKNPDGNYSNGSDVLMLKDGGRNKTTTDNGILTGEIILKPLKGWNITANYTFDGTFLNRTEHCKTYYHTLPSGLLTPRTYSYPNSLLRRTENNQRHIINLFTSYQKQFAGSHNFIFTAGFTQELTDNLRITSSNSNLYSDDIPSLATAYGSSIRATDLAEQLAIRSVFGRINYNYKERYLVELTSSYYGTSRFLKDVRWQFFPGVSAGWTVSKESFWEPFQRWFNFFKIRSTYGQQGSQGSLGYYPFYPALRTVKPGDTSSNWLFSDGQNPAVNCPSILVDPTLRWVSTTAFNVGTDMAFLSNRLTLAFEWYKRSAYDYIGPAESLPAIMGVAAPDKNNAAMETTGFDLTVGWKHQIGDFYYGINAVLGDYQTVITKYPNETNVFIRNDGITPEWYAGRVLGEIWGYETVGLFQTQEQIDNTKIDQSLFNAKPLKPGDVQYRDLDGDEKITWGNNTVDNPGDKRVIGNSTPRYSYGVTLNAEYKGFDFTVFFQGVGKRNSPANHFGGVTTFANMFWGIPRGGSEWQALMYEIHQDRWSKYNLDNSDVYFPRFYMSDENRKNTEEQTRYLQNAAYMRIKNMQLGYSIPAAWLHKVNFAKLRLFVNVENMATFTKMIKTLDPEFSTSDGKLYPLQRVWACGVNVTF